MDELHFEGDPATDSTRRRLERELSEESRPRWPWVAALAGSTALLFWQIRKRWRNGNGGETDRRGRGRGNGVTRD